jgi:hypothetical protein
LAELGDDEFKDSLLFIDGSLIDAYDSSFLGSLPIERQEVIVDEAMRGVVEGLQERSSLEIVVTIITLRNIGFT